MFGAPNADEVAYPLWWKLFTAMYSMRAAWIFMDLDENPDLTLKQAVASNLSGMEDIIMQEDLTRMRESKNSSDEVWRLFHPTSVPDTLFKLIFDALDYGGSGKISFRDLASAAKTYGVAMEAEAIQEMINQADTDGDGEVGNRTQGNIDEFLKIAQLAGKSKEELLIDIVRALDENGDGFMDVQEVKTLGLVLALALTACDGAGQGPGGSTHRHRHREHPRQPPRGDAVWFPGHLTP